MDPNMAAEQGSILWLWSIVVVPHAGCRAVAYPFQRLAEDRTVLGGALLQCRP